jgi:hypothetical protein
MQRDGYVNTIRKKITLSNHRQFYDTAFFTAAAFALRKRGPLLKINTSETAHYNAI